MQIPQEISYSKVLVWTLTPTKLVPQNKGFCVILIIWYWLQFVYLVIWYACFPSLITPFTLQNDEIDENGRKTCQSLISICLAEPEDWPKDFEEVSLTSYTHNNADVVKFRDSSSNIITVDELHFLSLLLQKLFRKPVTIA